MRVAVRLYVQGLVHYLAGVLLARTARFVSACLRELLVVHSLRNISMEDRLKPVTR
jgi:hypothetical protein